MARPKRSVSAADRLAARSCDPLGWMIREFQENPSWERALDLLPYQCPKLKAVEVRAEVIPHPLDFTLTTTDPAEAAAAYARMVSGT